MKLGCIIDEATAVTVSDVQNFLHFYYKDRPLYKLVEIPRIEYLAKKYQFLYLNTFEGVNYYLCSTPSSDFIIGSRESIPEDISTENTLILYSITYLLRSEFPKLRLKSKIPVAKLEYLDPQLIRRRHTSHVMDSLLSKYGTVCFSSSYSIEDWYSARRFLKDHGDLRFFVLDNYYRIIEISDPEKLASYVYDPSQVDIRQKFFRKNVVLMKDNYKQTWIF